MGGRCGGFGFPYFRKLLKKKSVTNKKTSQKLPQNVTKMIPTSMTNRPRGEKGDLRKLQTPKMKIMVFGHWGARGATQKQPRIVLNIVKKTPKFAYNRLSRRFPWILGPLVGERYRTNAKSELEGAPTAPK